MSEVLEHAGPTRVENGFRVTVVIPAFNESETIGIVLDGIRVLNDPRILEVIVVDDGSTDNTGEIARAGGAQVISHPYNLGNGASVASGIRSAKGEFIVFLDGDGQHPPEEIPRLLSFCNDYDMAVAARAVGSRLSWVRSFGNRFLCSVAEFLSEHRIDDLTSGFRVVRKACLLEFIHLFPQRYSYPTTITMAMLTSGYFVKYVATKNVVKRKHGRSQIRPFRDGLRFISIILRIIVLFNPLKVFLPFALLLFAFGILNGAYGVAVHQNIQDGTLLLLVSGCFFFMFGLLADQVASVRRNLSSLRKYDS